MIKFPKVLVIWSCTLGYISPTELSCHMFCRWRQNFQDVAHNFLMERVYAEGYTWTLISGDEYEPTNVSKILYNINFTSEMPPVLIRLSESPCVSVHMIHPTEDPEAVGEMWLDAYLFYWYEWRPPPSSLFFWVKDVAIRVPSTSVYFDEATEILCNIFYVVMENNGQKRIYQFDKGYPTDQSPFKPIDFHGPLISGAIPSPRFNNNMKQVKIMDILPATFRIEGIDCSQPNYVHCQPHDIEFLVYTRNINFTFLPAAENTMIGVGKAERPKIKLCGMLAYDSFDGIQSSRFAGEGKPRVDYCKQRPLLGTNWRVWFIPFQKEVWLAIVLLLVTPAFRRIREGWRAFLYEVFCMFSYGLNRPVTDIPKSPSYFMLALLIPILPCCYEGGITGRVIAPSAASPFHNIKELFLAGYSLVFYVNAGAGSNESYLGYDGDCLDLEFKRFGMESKRGTNFELTGDFPNKTLIAKGLTNKTAVMAGGHDTIMPLYYGWITGNRDDYHCSYFFFETTMSPCFHLYYVPFVHEILEISTKLGESGVVLGWDRIHVNAHKLGMIRLLRNPPEQLAGSVNSTDYSVVKSRQIKLQHLHAFSFFVLCKVCAATATVAWIGELLHYKFVRGERRKTTPIYPF